MDLDRPQIAARSNIVMLYRSIHEQNLLNLTMYQKWKDKLKNHLSKSNPLGCSRLVIVYKKHAFVTITKYIGKRSINF